MACYRSGTVEDAEEAEERVPTLARAGLRARGIPVAVTALLLAIGISTATPWMTVGAQAPASASPAQIELKRTTEDKQEMLVAKVTSNGLPVSGAVVAFSVTRMFGIMSLGEDQTLADGTAAVQYPHGLPGDGRGELVFSVEVRSPPALAGPPVQVKLGGAEPVRASRAEVPRALWSSRAPIGIVLSVFEVFKKVIAPLGSADEESAAFAICQGGAEDLGPSFRFECGALIENDEIETVTAKGIGFLSSVDENDGAGGEINALIGFAGRFRPKGTCECFETIPRDTGGLFFGGTDVPHKAVWAQCDLEHFGKGEMSFAEAATGD